MSNKIDMSKMANNMEKYIHLSQEIKTLESNLKEIRKRKTCLENSIIHCITTNQLIHKEFVKGKHKLTCEVSQRKDGLNQKFLKASLEDYFNKNYQGRLSSSRCNEKANEIFNYILDLRKERPFYSLKQMHI